MATDERAPILFPSQLRVVCEVCAQPAPSARHVTVGSEHAMVFVECAHCGQRAAYRLDAIAFPEPHREV